MARTSGGVVWLVAAVLAPSVAVGQTPKLPVSDTGKGGTVLMLVVPGLQASDLTRPELGCLDRVVAMGAVGWMNSRTGASRACPGDPVASGFLSLGAGTRACNPYAGPSLHADTASGPAWRHDIDGLRRINRGLLHRVEIGALGQICRQAGMSLRVVGDEGGDMPTWGGVLLACDPKGTVDSTDPAIAADPAAPYARRADLASYRRPGERSLTVWVFGDLLRAERYADACTPTQARLHRDAALTRLATMLTKRWLPFAREAGSRGNQAWLLSPTPSDQAHALDRLTPVALAGRGISPGLLASASTRRPGLIAMADVAATVAQYVGVEPPDSLVGRPARSSPSRHSTRTSWRRLHDDTLNASISQRALGPLPVVRLVTLVAIGIPALLAWRITEFEARHGLVLRAARPITDGRFYVSIGVGVAASALVQLWSGAWPSLGLTLGALVLATALLSGMAVGWAFPRTSGPVVSGLSLGMLAACAVGLTATRALLSHGWLSYSAMDGARYYGIGNEMAGALLAAGVVLSVPFLQRGRAWLVVGLIAVLAILLAWPSGGANLGASVAAGFGVAFATVVAFGSAGSRYASHSTPARMRLAVVVFVSAALMVGLLAAVYLVDAGGDASHIGRALGSDGSIAAIAARKLALNAHLLANSPWTLCLLVGVALAMGLPRVRPGTDRIGLRMLICVAAGLLIANDSGVVAAGMALSVGVPLLIAMDRQRLEPGQPQRVADHTD